MRAVLLDTCAIIWLGHGEALSGEARAVVAAAQDAEAVSASPISAWELSVAVAKGRLVLDEPVLPWFETFLDVTGCGLTPLTPRILVESSFLPGDFHKDPGDRIIVATARMLDLTIITRDRKILAYADHGFVKALAC